ncbi:hypothetical protein T265_08092 [Opisthorchis viverrini]|uniref:EGF-like domain-containing protein n=1 Tax=Opisthorchis viverrini TaxID=6198 RepID=A0A074ZAS6_OPIVI|nr:hypothetical protein T265_08092 [Opisthorchis viverrini]KER24203.1 hypothetical protein T265_08092 [Opisthorchis viverrini]
MLLSTAFKWAVLWSFLLTSSGYVYFIEQEAYDIHQFWACRGVPALKAQRVFLPEEATEVYYSTLMSGRFPEDKYLDPEVPPASILTSEAYLEVLEIVLSKPEEEFGNRLYMAMNCHLFNNMEWVRDVFNRALSRNTATVRAILDIIYRIGLCLRGIDTHLNCPDVCRNKQGDYCAKSPHSIGTCSSYLDDSILSVLPELTSNVSANTPSITTFHRQVPIQRRLPLDFFFRLNRTKEVIEIQKQIARTAYCPCRMYYRYDKFLDGCIDVSQDIGCGGSNPCVNGGRCVTKLVENTFGSEYLQEIATVTCECPPAFRGEFCELETDRCVEENVCGEFACLRDPHDMDNGYRCLCPPTHKRKSPGEPMCVPLPACGERLETLDETDEYVLSNPAATQNPCLNRGYCVQGEDPTMYTCICQPGYMGKNCEIEPPEATWGPWTSWSDCIWPEPYEICYKRPFQQQTRRCLKYKPGQRCIGSQRRQRHAGCDLNSGSPASFTGITSLKRERLKKSAELCELSGKQIQTSISEKILGEQLLSIEAVDDWSTVGLEDAPFLNLPTSLRHGDLQAVNWPRAEDLLFMTLWIYAVLIHIALILLWIYYIHRWRKQRNKIIGITE